MPFHAPQPEEKDNCKINNALNSLNFPIIDNENLLNGFTTASGKNIVLSKDSFEKANQLWIDSNSNPTKEHTLLESVENLQEFSSDKSERNQNENLIFTTRKLPKYSSSEFKDLDSKITCSNAFTTAAGKHISVKNESFDKTKQLWIDCTGSCNDDVLSLINYNENRKQYSKNSSIDSISTSKESAADHFKQELDTDCFDENQTPLNVFTTATGKPIAVKNESFDKIKQLWIDCIGSGEDDLLITTFDDEDLKNLSNSIAAPKQAVAYCDKELDNSGICQNLFTTAAGKNISVENETFDKVKLFFMDDVEQSCDDKSEHPHVRIPKLSGKIKHLLDSELVGLGVTENKTGLAFTTAAGKNISVHKNSFDKVNQLWTDCEEIFLIDSKDEKILRNNAITKDPDSNIMPNKLTEENYPNNRRTKPNVEFLKNEDELQHAKQLFLSSQANELEKYVLENFQIKNHEQNSFVNNVCDVAKIPLSLTQEIIDAAAALEADEQSNHSDDDLFPSFDETCCQSDDKIVNSDICTYKIPPSPVFECSSDFIILNGRRRKRRKIDASNDSCVKLLKNNDDENVGDVLPNSPMLVNSKSWLNNRRNRINDDIIKKREEAAIKQLEYILKKPKDQRNPLKGSLFLRKQKETRLKLKNFGIPRKLSKTEILSYGVNPCVANVNPKNALDFRFPAQFYYSLEVCYTNESGIPAGDNALLILSDSNSVGLPEISRAFLASPAVEPHLISHSWISNHYKWIVWKLSSMEMKFPHLLANQYATPNNVLLELKYRYDREIDNSQRSCLKRILEFDDAPNRKMVLCVSDIIEIAGCMNEYELELTDGWYAIKATVDMEMNHLIKLGKVQVGSKLAVCNASLIGLSEGCDPLELGCNVRLKISTNSTMRVPWYTRLGYCRCNARIYRTLATALPDGGIITELTALITRLYPIVYIRKEADGKSALLPERIMEKLLTEFEINRQIAIEKIYSQIKGKMMDTETMKLRNQGLDDYEVMNYSDLQREAVEEAALEQLPLKFKTNLYANTLLKIRLGNCGDGSRHNSNSKCAVLNIWRPTEDIISSVSEGTYLTLFNITASGKRNGELQLSTTNRTIYKFGHRINNNDNYFDRKLTKIRDLSNDDFSSTFDEVDIVGVIVNIRLTVQKQIVDKYQTVCLADQMRNIVAVTIRSEFFEIGYKDVLKVGSVIACSNLQWRRGYIANQIPVLYVNEFSVISRNPRQPFMRNGFEELTEYLKNTDSESVLSDCNCKLSAIFSPSNSPAGALKNNSDCIINKNDDDFKNSYPETPDSEKRKKNVETRIEKLKNYGNPPPLSPIIMLNSPRATVVHRSKNNFKYTP